MKLRSWCMLTGLIGVMLGLTAGDVLRTKRLSIVTDVGEPVIIQRAGLTGAGELIVNDANGRECFAVRDGQLMCASLEQRLTLIEHALGVLVPAGGAPSQSQPNVSGLSPRKILIKYPNGRPVVERVQIELVREKARPAAADGTVMVDATFRITNVAGRNLKDLNLTAVVDGRSDSPIFYGLLLDGYTTTETRAIKTATGVLNDLLIIDATREADNMPSRSPRAIQRP